MKIYHIIVIGCQMNRNDAERIAACLEGLGYVQGESDVADLVVLVTCGVRQSAENRVYGFIPDIKKNNPKCKVVVTGCLSERRDVIRRLKRYVDIWFNISNLPQLPQLLGSTIHAPYDNDYLKIFPKRSSDFSAFVSLGNGCNNFCTYCVVPYARGREVYRDKEDIMREVRDLAQRGYREIFLIAQNVNSYKSGSSDFADLLKEVDDLSGDFWIRFFTSHPKDMSDKLIEVMGACQKLCHHLHLPAQAGNNDILKAMNRKYTVEHYMGLIDKLKAVMPDLFISTDIIVGFPGETNEQFQDTLRLFKYVGYDMAYIGQYSPRPGTAAYNLVDDVSDEEKRRREDELMLVLRQTALSNSQTYLNKEVRVLIEGKNKRGEWFGKTEKFKSARAAGPEEVDLTGTFVNFKIDHITDFGISGTISS